jgi:hypothetical protein
MISSTSNIIRAIALALLATVLTQIFYVATLAEVGMVEGWPTRSIVWSIETLVFALLAVAALAAASADGRYRLVWAAIAVSGTMNAIQAGIGLSMFLPPTEAGESGKVVFDTVLAGAFLFFFLAKALLGLAAVGLGSALLRKEAMPMKIVGGLAILAGISAALLNVAALPQGLALVMPAGAAGTAATLLLAIAAWLVSSEKS